MHNAGVPLRVIQKISGHSSLATLQRYLEVSDEQVIEAVGVIGAKSPPKIVNPTPSPHDDYYGF
jgi:integrase/recombinase XerD